MAEVPCPGATRYSDNSSEISLRFAQYTTARKRGASSFTTFTFRSTCTMYHATAQRPTSTCTEQDACLASSLYHHVVLQPSPTAPQVVFAMGAPNGKPTDFSSASSCHDDRPPPFLACLSHRAPFSEDFGVMWRPPPQSIHLDCRTAFRTLKALGTLACGQSLYFRHCHHLAATTLAFRTVR